MSEKNDRKVLVEMSQQELLEYNNQLEIIKDLIKELKTIKEQQKIKIELIINYSHTKQLNSFKLETTNKEIKNLLTNSLWDSVGLTRRLINDIQVLNSRLEKIPNFIKRILGA